jgi:predicted Ser/Thr protein kinase
MAALIGRTLGQSQILEEIGRGGMAVVYKAYQPSLQRYVALKVLPPRLSFDTTFVRRFLQEGRVAARLDHPSIVTIHDVGEQGGVYYIVMEYLEGAPLDKLLRRTNRLPVGRVNRIVTQVASALDYAHAQGVVHRDIKPSNIIVGPNDHATLTDFGIAKAVEGTRLTLTGTVVGTPEYMSPEQAKGEAVGPATDVYSLGIVLYEMLAGLVPFEADSSLAILHKQVYERPRRVRTHASHLPAGVDDVLSKALAKEPVRRFRSAGELARALQMMVTGKPLRQVGPQPTAPAVGALGRRGLRWVTPALAGLVVVAALAYFGWWQGGRKEIPNRTPLVAVSRTAQQSPTSITPTADTTETQVTVGQELDIVGKNPAGDWWQVCCLNGQRVWIIGRLVQTQGDVDSVEVVLSIPPSPPTPVPGPRPTPTPAVQCEPWHGQPAAGHGLLLVENHTGEEFSMDYTIGGSGHWIVAAKEDDIAGRWWMELPVGYHEFKYKSAPRGSSYLYGYIKLDVEDQHSYVSPLWLNWLADDLIYAMEVPEGCR